MWLALVNPWEWLKNLFGSLGNSQNSGDEVIP